MPADQQMEQLLSHHTSIAQLSTNILTLNKRRSEKLFSTWWWNDICLFIWWIRSIPTPDADHKQQIFQWKQVCLLSQFLDNFFQLVLYISFGINAMYTVIQIIKHCFGKKINLNLRIRSSYAGPPDVWIKQNTTWIIISAVVHICVSVRWTKLLNI